MVAYEAELVVDPITGRIELRGPVDFVKAMLPEVKTLSVGKTPQSESSGHLKHSHPKSDNSVDAAGDSTLPRKTAKKSGNTNVGSVPFDISGKADGGLSLSKFFAEKKPGNSHDALIPFFTYYGHRHASLKGVAPGHLMYCYEQLGLKKPGNIYAAMNNARQRAKKVVTGPESNTLVPNVAGENWIKFDLPAKVTMKA